MPDIYQTVTDNIVRAIEAGAGKWRMPWHTTREVAEPEASSVMMPRNVTGSGYRGINVPILWATASAFGYGSPLWGTYKQWAEKGAQVRKGEKAAMVVFWKKLAGKPTGEKDSDGEDITDRGGMMARGYFVFNRAQVDGYAPKIETPIAAPAEPLADRRIASAEAFFAATKSIVRHGGNKAFYMPSVDQIQMPHFVQFPNPIDYYAILAHEHAHWTSAKARCNRDLLGARFGNQAYAFEELVAELGAAYVCAQLGLSNEPRPDHAAYLTSWLKVLKDDKRAIFAAASKAQAACDYLISLQGSNDEERMAA